MKICIVLVQNKLAWWYLIFYILFSRHYIFIKYLLVRPSQVQCSTFRWDFYHSECMFSFWVCCKYFNYNLIKLCCFLIICYYCPISPFLEHGVEVIFVNFFKKCKDRCLEPGAQVPRWTVTLDWEMLWGGRIYRKYRLIQIPLLKCYEIQEIFYFKDGTSPRWQ